MTDSAQQGVLPGLRDTLGRLARGEVSPAEMLEETERACAALPEELNPFVAVDFEGARRQAVALPAPGPGLPLYGLPMALKDLEPTRDLPSRFGAVFVDGSVPRSDGLLADRLRRAGAVIYGKTTTPAFGHKDVTDSLVNGVTRSPWGEDLTPGGSSGGAGVLVSTGVSLLAHGTDAAGSVRMPAALCGVVGFKPSYGRIPRIPSKDLWAARGHHGFLSRRVDDVRVWMSAVAGGDPRDPISPSEQHWDTQPPREPRGRIAIVDTLFGVDVDPGVSHLMSSVRDKLSDAGFAVESPKVGWEDPVGWANRWASALEYYFHGMLHREHPELFSPSHAAQIALGPEVTGAEMVGVQLRRTELHLAATELMDAYDFILTPTLPRRAWRVDDDYPEVDGRRVPYGPGGRWADVLLANLTGWPAISIPCGLDEGLPVGLQIMAPWRADSSCIDFAERVEEILGREARVTPPGYPLSS